MDIQKNFGLVLQQIRKQRNMSQEQLALAADIDRRYMSDIENGKRNISLDIVSRIAECLEMEVWKLFQMTETIDIPPLTIQSLKDWLCDHDYENSVVFENPDYLSAVVGVSENGRVIYDYNLMVEDLMKQDDMEYEDAVEFIDFNTIGSLPYAGEMSPIILYHIDN